MQSVIPGEAMKTWTPSKKITEVIKITDCENDKKKQWDKWRSLDTMNKQDDELARQSIRLNSLKHRNIHRESQKMRPQRSENSWGQSHEMTRGRQHGRDDEAQALWDKMSTRRPSWTKLTEHRDDKMNPASHQSVLCSPLLSKMFSEQKFSLRQCKVY